MATAREMTLKELVDSLPRPKGVDQPTHRAAKEYYELIERIRDRATKGLLAQIFEKPIDPNDNPTPWLKQYNIDPEAYPVELELYSTDQGALVLYPALATLCVMDEDQAAEGYPVFDDLAVVVDHGLGELIKWLSREHSQLQDRFDGWLKQRAQELRGP